MEGHVMVVKKRQRGCVSERKERERDTRWRGLGVKI